MQSGNGREQLLAWAFASRLTLFGLSEGSVSALPNRSSKLGVVGCPADEEEAADAEEAPDGCSEAFEERSLFAFPELAAFRNRNTPLSGAKKLAGRNACSDADEDEEDEEDAEVLANASGIKLSKSRSSSASSCIL